MTGYNGLFGYRTNQGEDIEEARQVAGALVAKGYKLAFYTYENIGYGQTGAAQIQLDIQKWQEEAEPIVGKLDVLVYAQNSDISGKEAYAGERFEVLYEAGFRTFVGFASDGNPWLAPYGGYIRQGRIMVSGETLKNQPQWFASMFDSVKLITDSRGE